MSKPTSWIWKAVWLPFKGVFKLSVFLIKGKLLNQKTGARFAPISEYRQYLNPRNRGLMLDGQRLKLSEVDSYRHLLVVGRPGAHKTTAYVVPNIFERAKHTCSMLINDPKGEIHEITAGYLRAQGFEVHIIAPENPEVSSRINPLLEAQSEIELEQIAETLIYADPSSDKSDFWAKAAMRFVSLFLKVARNAGQNNTNYNTLANVLMLLQNFGEAGDPLSDVMGQYCLYPDDPLDSSLFNEWLGLTSGNADGIQSALLTALTALRWLTNRNLVNITSASDFRFSDMRRRKLAIFIATPPQYSKYYAAFTSMLFKCAFDANMRTMPRRSDLPIYLFHDEFATSYIPNFSDIANTARGYKISISAIVQSQAQIKQRYGIHADAIMGAFSGYLTYSGSDLITTEFFTNMVGKVRERQKRELTDTTDTYREYSLMNADDIRRLGDKQTLFITKNKQPVILDYVPFFDRFRYRLMAKQYNRYRSHMQPIENNVTIDMIPL